jgi:hypothetical protein
MASAVAAGDWIMLIIEIPGKVELSFSNNPPFPLIDLTHYFCLFIRKKRSNFIRERAQNCGRAGLLLSKKQSKFSHCQDKILVIGKCQMMVVETGRCQIMAR